MNGKRGGRYSLALSHSSWGQLFLGMRRLQVAIVSTSLLRAQDFVDL